MTLLIDEIDFLTTLRDSAQSIVNAANLILEAKAPPTDWNPKKIQWESAVGTRGPYKKATPQATPDFKKMLNDLMRHGGKLTRDNLFYWVFNDDATVGRKKIQPKNVKG